MEQSKIVRVGVSVLIVQDQRLLLGKRLGSHGAGTWAPPGGHLEVGETFKQCAKREVLEETGMILDKCYHLTVTNDIYDNGLHYVTIFMRATSVAGIPQNLEPEKCEGWMYVPLKSVISASLPLFLPVSNLFIGHGYRISR